MAKAGGISANSVQRIWRSHGLQPHRFRQFKLSKEPKFIEKLQDIVGFYRRRPNTRWFFPLTKRAKSRLWTAPAKPSDEEGPLRNRDARLQAAWRHNAVCCPQRPRGHCNRPQHAAPPAPGVHPLSTPSRQKVPAGKVIHAIIDNYAAHKHPKVLAWLEGHPRWVFHFTPTSCSWLNPVEGFFAKLTNRRLKRVVFRSVTDLQAAINRFLEEHNREPKPFVWTKDPHKIIAAVKRGNQMLDSIH